MLECDGWVGPPHNFQWFLTQLFTSIEANGGARPRLYDAAYLGSRYRSEFGIAAIPAPVQRVLFPVVLAVGRVLGWHRRYAGAPEPAGGEPDRWLTGLAGEPPPHQSQPYPSPSRSRSKWSSPTTCTWPV